MIEHSVEQVDDHLVAKFPLAKKHLVNVRPHTVTPIVYFGKDEDGIQIDVSDLLEMYNFVCYSVIPRFAVFYK